MCKDGTADDDYPETPNCEDNGAGYVMGGQGGLLDDKEERLSAKLSVAQRVKAAGHHVIKAGIDIEDNRAVVQRGYSGDAYYTNYLNRQIDTFRYVDLDADGTDICGYELDAGGAYDDDRPIPCSYLRGYEAVTGQTINWSAYLQDSWSVLPNVTFNYGVRYEEQRLRYAEHLRGTFDPATQQEIGKNALVLQNMWAPRLGFVYDWTKEGRSKVYGNVGRFFESVPMRINERSFGGETTYRQAHRSDKCGDVVPELGGPSGAGRGRRCETTSPLDAGG